jgi:competence protein ComEC
MDPSALFLSIKQRVMFLFFVFVLFSINCFFIYTNYKDFRSVEIFQTDAVVLNIYHKKDYDVLKLKTKNFTFFTSTTKSNKQIKLFNNINITIITKGITFFDYLKGFYTKSFNLTYLSNSHKYKMILIEYINKQHNSKDISSLYKALFLATPIDQNIRTFANNFGISHLIAISGFHLGVITFILYFILHILYKPIHQKYLPYRNKKYDLMLFISFLLFCYLIFVNIVPSLLRAFVMFIFALYYLRNNIKILSFETLFVVVLVIVSIYPNLLFSLSLWFSIAGVFYIFLFIKYFKKLNKTVQFLLFNFWLYLAINPIVHLFFPTLSLAQLFSPILTILFTIFYPIGLFLHIVNFGYILDPYILYLINLDIKSVEIFTPTIFFVYYILLSFLSVFSKRSFWLLNISFVLFNIWLFYFPYKQYF